MAAEQSMCDGRTTSHNRNAEEEKIPFERPYDSPAFQVPGQLPGLEGVHYDYCPDSFQHQVDLYKKTTEAVAYYVIQNYENGGDIHEIVTNLALPILTRPEKPPKGASDVDQMIWETEFVYALRRESCLERNLHTLYFLLWGQCSEALLQQLEFLPGHATIESQSDGLALLQAIKHVVFSLPRHQYGLRSWHDLMRQFYACSQGKNEPLCGYLRRFQNIQQVNEYNEEKGGEHYGRLLLPHQPLEDVAQKRGQESDEKVSESSKTLIKKEARESYFATASLLGSDPARFGGLIIDLQNRHLLGRDLYPKTVMAAYRVLDAHEEIHANQSAC